MEMSFWWNFRHWMHWKLSFWQLSLQPVSKMSSKFPFQWELWRFLIHLSWRIILSWLCTLCSKICIIHFRISLFRNYDCLWLKILVKIIWGIKVTSHVSHGVSDIRSVKRFFKFFIQVNTAETPKFFMYVICLYEGNPRETVRFYSQNRPGMSKKSK